VATRGNMETTGGGGAGGSGGNGAFCATCGALMEEGGAGSQTAGNTETQKVC